MTGGRVEPRDVFTVLWVTLAFLIALYVLYQIRQVLVWLLVAVFLATVLSPPVRALRNRGMRRGLAVAVVILALLAVVGAVTFAFVKPVVEQSIAFAEKLPALVDEVSQAPLIQSFVDRFNLNTRIEGLSKTAAPQLLGASGPLLSAFATVGEAVAGLLTVFVLTIFLLLYGPGYSLTGLALIKDSRRREEVSNILHEVRHSVSGWVAGNLLTSLIAATIAFIVFLVTGLPFSALLALWVGIADLIPLVGATLGAIPAVIVAFLFSLPAGIVVLVYFIVYQQIENHILQPIIYGRTIRLNPFLVFLSILIGVELAGFLGAMLALPFAGAIQVVLNHVAARSSRLSSLAGAGENSAGSASPSEKANVHPPRGEAAPPP